MGIVLGTMALVSLFVSAGTSRLLANTLLPLDPGGAATAAVAARPGTSASSRKDPTNILRRNIFDSAMGAQDGERVAAGAADGAEDEPVVEPVLDDPSHPPSPCQGSVRLVGSFYWPRWPDRSFAAITDAAGKVKLYRMGGLVDGREVVAIGSSMVYLRPSGQAMCSIGMFVPPAAAGGSAPAADATPAAQAVAPEPPAAAGDEGSIPAADLDRGITRVSDTEYSITRSLVDRVLANQADLMRQVRIVPQEENGRVTGVKMYGIRRNSVVGRLGLQNGDTLRTINGYDMTSPDSALEAYTRLRSADHLTLSVVRRGAPTNMNYSIH